LFAATLGFENYRGKDKMTPAGIATLIKIVEASIEVFAQEGFYAANTQEIAEKAGVAESTIFRRFETKDELFRECMRTLMSRTLDPTQFQALIFKESGPSEDEFAGNVIAAMKRWYTRMPVSAARLVLYTSLSKIGEWRNLGSERTNKIISILAERIEQEARNRHMRKLDAHAASISMISGLLYLKSVRSGSRERDSEMIEVLIRQWIYGLFHV
jgi:AcrR family transcriptional regulator